MTHNEKLKHYIEALTALSEGKEIECLKRNLDGNERSPKYHISSFNFTYPVPDFDDYNDFRVKRERQEVYVLRDKVTKKPAYVYPVTCPPLGCSSCTELVKFREVSDD